MTCTAACQRAESPGCLCRECRGQQHGTLAAQRRLPLEVEEPPRQALDIEVAGKVIHVSPGTRHFLDGRTERGWIARLDGGRRRCWGRTPEEAARG